MEEKTVQGIIGDYVKKDSEFRQNEARIKEKIKQREAQTERLKKKLGRLDYPSWIDSLVKPIAELLLPFFPGRRYEILGPFGLSCETAIHFYKNRVPENEETRGGNCLSISFRPGDLDLGELFVVDHTVNTKRHSEGTMGDMNGMNHPTVPMQPDVKWLIAWMNKQNKSKKR